MNSASLFSLAGRYDNPLPLRFLAPVDSLKIPVLYRRCGLAYPYDNVSWEPKEKTIVGLLLFNLLLGLPKDRASKDFDKMLVVNGLKRYLLTYHFSNTYCTTSVGFWRSIKSLSWLSLKNKTHRRQGKMSSFKKVTWKGTLWQLFIYWGPLLRFFVMAFKRFCMFWLWSRSWVENTNMTDCTQ